jgi:hypothetical protein
MQAGNASSAEFMRLFAAAGFNCRLATSVEVRSMTNWISAGVNLTTESRTPEMTWNWEFDDYVDEVIDVQDRGSSYLLHFEERAGGKAMIVTIGW